MHWTTFEWVVHSLYSFLFMWVFGNFQLWEITLIAVAVGCYLVALGLFP